MDHVLAAGAAPEPEDAARVQCADDDGNQRARLSRHTLPRPGDRWSADRRYRLSIAHRQRRWHTPCSPSIQADADRQLSPLSDVYCRLLVGGGGARRNVLLSELSVCQPWTWQSTSCPARFADMRPLRVRDLRDRFARRAALETFLLLQLRRRGDPRLPARRGLTGPGRPHRFARSIEPEARSRVSGK